MYIFGEPGSGKSTLLAHLTRMLWHGPDAEHPFAHRVYACGVTELGARRKDFPGTDALSMSVQPRVVEWLGDTNPQLVIGEGDRLANGKFFDAVRNLGYSLKLYVLVGEEASALHRRIRGSEQDDKWLAGRRTKVYNLKDEWWPYQLAAGDPLPQLEREIYRTAYQLDNQVAQTLQEAHSERR